MTGGWLPLFWLMFLLAAGAWLLSTLALTPMIGAFIDRVRDPVTRSRRVLLTALVPWLIPMTLGAAVVATAGSKAIGWIVDHCAHHGLGHPHLCFSHLPAIELGLIHGAAIGIAVILVLSRAVQLVRAECRGNRALGLLKALAGSRGRLRIVPSPAPFALAGGLREPVVVLSSGLLDQLSFRERRIVTAHETAHLRHGDARRNVLFELLLLMHLPWNRRRLRGQWLRSLEERADDAVARRFGAERVVETLLHVARLRLSQPAPGFSVAGAGLAGRAQRLLDDGSRHPHRNASSFEIVYVAVLATLFPTAVMGHHALETLLGFLAGH